MFSNVVVGFDGSEASERALIAACEIVKKFNSELHLVHTPQPKTVAFAMGAVAGYHAATTMPSKKEIELSCENILESAVKIAKRHDVRINKSHTEQGDPAEKIVACAKSCGADLIVTGRRGLGSVKSMVQGSTTLKVNHIANCACLSTA